MGNDSDELGTKLDASEIGRVEKIVIFFRLLLEIEL